MQYGTTDEELANEPLTYRDDLFAGKVALISGAGRGIGKATARSVRRPHLGRPVGHLAPRLVQARRLAAL